MNVCPILPLSGQQVTLFLDEFKKHAPYEGAKVNISSSRRLDIFIRPKGTETWVYGTTARSAIQAWTCMNYVRRAKPWLDVSIRPNLE